jgi:hypothetical protein
MAIFAIHSTKDVHEDSPNSPRNDSTQGTTPSPNAASRPTEDVPEEMMQFDDDMAHFVTHVDADPLAESEHKMQLIEYHTLDDGRMIRETTDDEEDYT